MNRILAAILLLTGLCNAFAQQIWHRPDSTITLPSVDSILPTEEYTIVAVMKSLEPDTLQLLWGVRSDDTIRFAFLTNAHFSCRGGFSHSQSVRDYSKWCVLYSRTGCRMDTTQTHALWLGPAQVYYTDSIYHADSISANVEIRELFYTSSPLSRVAKASWQSYMAMKYGITLDYVPYVSPAGDTLWHHEDDAEYYHRIVAVGTDSTHEWSATISSSLENASLAIQVADQLVQGEYILLGDNGLDETFIMSPDGYDCLSRTWRLRSHTQRNYGCSIVWTPMIQIPHPDSVWLDVRDSLDEIVYSLPVDSVVGDTAWFFSLPEMQPEQTLSFRTIRTGQIESFRNNVSYDASSGTISLSMLDFDKIYSYALYTNLGHLLFWPAPSRPDCIQVGNLPTGIYRIEAFENNQMAVSVPIIVH